MTTPEETLAKIRAVINAGVTQSSTDGTSVTLDLPFLASRERQLALDDLESIVSGRVRPLFTTARMPYQ